MFSVLSAPDFHTSFVKNGPLSRARIILDFRFAVSRSLFSLHKLNAELNQKTDHFDGKIVRLCKGSMKISLHNNFAYVAKKI